MLGFEQIDLVACARCDFDNIALECEGQEVDDRKQVDQRANQTYRFRSLNVVSLATFVQITLVAYISTGVFFDMSRPL